MSYEQLPHAFRQGTVPTSTVKLAGIGRFTLSQRTTAKVTDWDKASDVARSIPGAMMRCADGAGLDHELDSSARLLKEGVEPDPETHGIEANTYSYTRFTKE